MDRSAEALERFIRQHTARVLARPIEDIPADAELELLGMSSSNLALLAGELEERLGTEVDPSILFERGSIRATAERLASLCESAT